MKISARNIFEGKITSLVDGKINAEVEVTTAGGDRIVAVVTESSVQSLGLALGKPVLAFRQGTLGDRYGRRLRREIQRSQPTGRDGSEHRKRDDQQRNPHQIDGRNDGLCGDHQRSRNGTWTQTRRPGQCPDQGQPCRPRRPGVLMSAQA